MKNNDYEKDFGLQYEVTVKCCGKTGKMQSFDVYIVKYKYV